jgi:hypothetical protein
VSLKKIKVAASPFDGKIYLFREGKRPGVALDRREATGEVMGAFIQHMMFEVPEGDGRHAWCTMGDGKSFAVTVARAIWPPTKEEG